MNRKRRVFIVLLAAAVIVSTFQAFPLMNIVLYDNADGWFTMQNIEDQQAEWDELAGEGERITVLTGHPSYVIGSDDVHVLFDMPRNHYFATTFYNTSVGERFYGNMTEAIRQGQAEYALTGPMTKAMVQQNETMRKAFNNHYCRVNDEETQAPFQKTGGTLYRWVNDTDACPQDEHPNVERSIPDE